MKEPTPAQRPMFSALDCQKLEHTFDLRLPVWGAALELVLDYSDDGLKELKWIY